MLRFVGTATVARSPRDVFSFVSDYANDPRWRRGLESIAFTTPPPVGIGSRAVEVLRVYGQRLETVTEVVEFEPERKMVAKSVSGPTPVVATRLVEPDGAGCRVTYQIDVDESGVLLFRVLRPLLKRMQQRQIDGFMVRLKDVLEAAPSA